MKDTAELMNEIKHAKNILDYMERNQGEMHLNTLAECLNEWLPKKGCQVSDVVRKSNLNKFPLGTRSLRWRLAWN